MATEAVPQTGPDPQLDAELINYDADISANDKEWSFPNSGIESATLADANNETSSHLPEMTGDSLNEIDWEDHPQPGSIEAPPVPTELGTGEADLPVDAEPLNPEFQEEGALETEELPDQPANEVGSHELQRGEEMVEHEITYDEEDDPVEPAKDSEGNVAGEDADAGASGEAHAEDEPNLSVDEARADEVEDDEFEVHGDLEDATAHENPSTEQSQDDSGVLPPKSLDITVTYKNAEYPLIHGQDNIDTQMGFFEDTSALDLTIDNLLAKFREELTDDLGPEDEVVLQVDELGLEYAESTHRDHLSGVTLRQLHEIFDQLAKNQEPDVARTLYTNLILRPHPAKRLEMLIDEAFNGKGLDEVIYCFQPNVSEQQAHAGEDEEIYESSDNEGAQSAGAEDEDVSPDEDHSLGADGEEEDDGESQAEYQDDHAAETGDVDAGDADGDIEHYDGFADLDTTAPPQAPQFQEPLEIPDDPNDELDIIEVDGTDLATQNGIEEHSLSAPDTICYCDQCLFGSKTDEGAARKTVQPSQQRERKANVDASPDGVYNGYSAQQNANDETNVVDNSGFDLIEIADDDDIVGGGDRSATATLTGDGVNEIDFEESDLANIANADVFLQGSSADPANEIDWRDFPEEGESGLKDTFSPSVKRPRPEGDDGEELLMEGQNDVKRRRSS